MWSAFERYVDKTMSDQQIVGVAVAVAQNGEVIYQNGFGVRDLATQAPVTPETVFGTASVSKSFTALVIMQLASEGRLSVIDPVIKYLPELRLRGVEKVDEIKIHHLLSHTSGIPPMHRRQELRTFDQHIEYLNSAEYQMLGKPGDYLSYCNDGFLLLGAIIERLTGRLYRRVMTERVLDRLEMNRSTYTLEELARMTNVTVPYLYNKKTQSHDPAEWPELGNYEVGGGVRASAVDLVKYGQLYLRGGEWGGRSLVDPKLLQAMWQPVYPIGRMTAYGYALQSTPYGAVTLVEHGGSQPGVSSNFGFVPERGLTVAALTNVTGVSANAIWLAAVNTALGLPLTQKRSIEPEYQASPDELQSFVGRYRSAEGGNLRVFAEDDGLRLENEGEQFALRASSDHTLVYDYRGQKVLRFHFRDGKPWAVFAGLRMLRRTEE